MSCIVTMIFFMKSHLSPEEVRKEGLCLRPAIDVRVSIGSKLGDYNEYMYISKFFYLLDLNIILNYNSNDRSIKI